MKLQNSFLLREYLRPQMLPTTWCPGCGLGIVMSSIAQAIHYQGLAKRDVAMVSGIGCTGRMSGNMDFATVHTTHGRAPAFATGLKLARPDMHVLVVMGDGDAMAIGGNHLIHAMRRNIGLTAIVVNNAIYGLTGGQAAPTTPVGSRTTTSRGGSIEQPMNLEALACAVGVSWFARATVSHTAALVKVIERALAAPGFAMVEILSNCHVHYGRMNDLGTAAQMQLEMEEQTRRTTPVLLRRATMPRRLGADTGTQFHDDARVLRGVILERARGADYAQRYHSMMANAEGVS